MMEAEGRKLAVRSKGPIEVRRGTVISVRLSLDDLKVDEDEDVVLWSGEAGNASFIVRVPGDVRSGKKAGSARIRINGLEVAKINFVLTVGEWQDEVGEIQTRKRFHRRAFASYSSKDQDAVLARIQGMQKIMPSLEVFMDVISLRSGEYWAERLWEVIPANDVFYLFWSANARRSRWVEGEWRCALETRGLGFIDPVPLISPRLAPPPDELASRHFNDWMLAFMGSAG